MGVFSDGSYNTPVGVMFSFPVRCSKGTWTIVQVGWIGNLSRIQINNGNTITGKSYFVEDGNVYCDISTLLSSNFIEVNENSFNWNEQAEYNGVIEISTTTVTATNNGNNLIIEYSDDPDYSEYYSRTNLTDPCE